MKKILYFTLALCALVMTSCSKEEPGGTATQATAGTWYGTFGLCDDNGNIIPGEEDCYNFGDIKVYTYNTNENVSTKMYIDDFGEFWDFKIAVDVDPVTMTFKTDGFVDNESYKSKVKITNGKIIKNGGKQKNGSVCDIIEFNVEFDDDAPGTIYKYVAVRYSGLADNN